MFILNGQAKAEDFDIKEVLISKIKSSEKTDYQINQLMQSRLEAIEDNSKGIKRVINIVTMENAILKNYIEAKGLYADFVDYAIEACNGYEKKVNGKKAKQKNTKQK